MNSETQCGRCGETSIKSWWELSDEEREVVKRLPASADYSQKEREASHRWCTRCWQEQTCAKSKV